MQKIPPFGPKENSKNPAQDTRTPAQASGTLDELTKIFNSALLTTRADSQPRDFSAELIEAVRQPAFRAVLQAVRQHAILNGLTDRQAAEEVITVFRKIDSIWSDYVLQEGLDRVRAQSP